MCSSDLMTRKQKKVFIRILIAAVLVLALLFIPIENPWLRLALFMVPYLVIGYDILRKAFLGVIHGEVFDENFLMAVATVGAILLGEYTEGVAVMLFYQIGELFQSYAVGKSRGNIAKLMDIRPDYANIEVDGRIEQVDPEEVEIGTLITVMPGEKAPIDGVVEEGEASLNTSALTGESLPRQVGIGDQVISGSVNMSGVLKLRTTKEFSESTVSKILELVENSSMKKSRSENFITRFARYYTPAVCYGALALALLPPVLSLIFGYGPHWSMWVTRALTTLVISCPCALVISIPLSFFGGIGGASAKGILVKGSNYLEALSETKYVVCDKTGTLTKGVFEVTGKKAASGFTEEELIEYAACAESYSGHPISRSLREAYGKEIDRERVKDVEEISGHGVCAYVDGRLVAAGNRRLMERLQITPEEVSGIGTQVYVAVDGIYAGCILISDVVKPGAREALASLKKAGVEKIVMLTGDAKPVAEAVAAELGVDEARSELLPADKVNEVEKLLAAKGKKEKLAFEIGRAHV